MRTLVIGVDPASARPLDASLRRSMERRFRADFGKVRIHTGPLAAAAARALGAEAFTAGRDIFFAAGRFAPGTTEGRWLLAHELAHVLQQRSQPARGRFVLGAADDPQERRAVELAREAMTSGRTTPVVCDSGRVVRRSVAVDDASATITLDFAGAVPNTLVLTEPIESPTGKSVQKTLVTLHLTRNFVPGATRDIGAWTATGRVGVKLDSVGALELRAWHFGFIQFMEITELSALYAGRDPSEGGIKITANVPPALAQAFGRDALGTVEVNPPWTTTDTSGDKAFNRNGIIESRTEDHPQLTVVTDLFNRQRHYRNFLFRITDKRKFTVVFSAREPQPAATFRHLAHFDIKLVYDFDVTWRLVGGEFTPLVTRRPEAEITPGPVRRGAPTDAAIKPFLNDPAAGQRVGTEELKAAIRSAVDGHPPNREDSKTRIGSPPADFFL